MKYDLRIDVRSLTIEQQLERMTEQRNALAKLADELAEEARDRYEYRVGVDEIIGNTYLTEGVNILTGDEVGDWENSPISSDGIARY